MRLLPILPILLSIAALILGFLCIFAGNKPGFLEDYSILTLNTSRIGRNIINTTATPDDPDEGRLESFFNDITDDIKNEIGESLNDFAGSIAEELGFKDFYSIHIMGYCQGFYEPGPVPNATVKDISMNVTACSNQTAMFTFDPREALERSLNETDSLGGTTAGAILNQLNWPDAIDDGIRALRTAFKAQFVLYCVAVGMTFLTILAAAFWLFSGGRGGALVNIVFATLAFLCMAIASAISTAISVKASDTINKYGDDIGLAANKGTKFMAISWAATGCLFIAAIAGCLGCFGASRRNKVRPYGEKP